MVALVENGRVIAENIFGDNDEYYRLYRFGNHPAGSHESEDGLYMTNNFTDDRIKLVLDPGGTKMQVLGTQDDDTPLVLFQTHDATSTALEVKKGATRLRTVHTDTVTADLISTAEFQCDGDVFLTGTLKADQLYRQ